MKNKVQILGSKTIKVLRELRQSHEKLAVAFTSAGHSRLALKEQRSVAALDHVVQALTGELRNTK